MPRGHVFLKTVAAGLVLAAAASRVQAQDAVADVQVRKISTIMNSKVLIQDNQPAGQIVDVVYNDGGCIDYYVASYNNQMYVVPFDVVQYRAADRVAFIDIAPAQFRQVSFFSSNQWPNIYAPNFRNQVFASFNVRGGGANARSRTTFRQGTDVNVNGQNRDGNIGDRNANDRDGAARDRTNAADRDRANRDPNSNRPNASDRNSDRPNATTDRPERTPSTNPPSANDRDEKTPAPPRAGSGSNPGRDGASPPKAGSDTNPGRGESTPPPAGVKPESVPGAGANPPSANKPNPPSASKPNPPSSSKPTPPPANPDKDDPKKPLPAPPTVPK